MKFLWSGPDLTPKSHLVLDSSALGSLAPVFLSAPDQLFSLTLPEGSLSISHSEVLRSQSSIASYPLLSVQATQA